MRKEVLKDVTYDGIKHNGWLYSGLGQLTDGVYGAFKSGRQLGKLLFYVPNYNKIFEYLSSNEVKLKLFYTLHGDCY